MSEQQFTGRILEVRQDGMAGYSAIQAAVNDAQPGDTILVHNGIYREEIVIPEGGTSEESRIVIKAAGENVVITGANHVDSGWEWDAETGLYILKLLKDYFGFNAEGEYFNPFAELWKSRGAQYAGFFSCGCVYINDIAMNQQWAVEDCAATENSWYAEVNSEDGVTTVYANFGEQNPLDEQNVVEINTRMQCITAKWNQGYITLDGLTVTRGCGPKTIDFWMKNAEPMYGAIATNGGHHWIIENCNIVQNRGVAVDFGSGSARQEIQNGGEPEIYGHHIIRNNKVCGNGTNGIMAYRGAYTEIYGNELVNNNALNTGLASEGYIKDVAGGWGIYIHDNYFYSSQEWNSIPIWMDSECDMCRVSRNIIYCQGNGKGFSNLDYECNGGWNLIDNNIFVGVGISIYSSSSTSLVNNLWIDINETGRMWPPKAVSSGMGSEGYDGYLRAMRLAEPGTLKRIGKNTTSRYQTFNNDNKMLGNLFFTKGLTNVAPKKNMMGAPLDKTSTFYKLMKDFLFISGSSIEPAENPAAHYGEMILNTEINENTGELLADPDYSCGCWKVYVPGTREADKIGHQKYEGISAWIPADEEDKVLLQKQLQLDGKPQPYANECDYNVYLAGAQKIDNPEYGAAHGYQAEIHSIQTEAGYYEIKATPDSFELILDVDDAALKTGFTVAKGEMLGIPAVYKQAAEKYVENLDFTMYYPDDVDTDYFGIERREGFTAVGPFAELKEGRNQYTCWPKSDR